MGKHGKGACIQPVLDGISVIVLLGWAITAIIRNDMTMVFAATGGISAMGIVCIDDILGPWQRSLRKGANEGSGWMILGFALGLAAAVLPAIGMTLSLVIGCRPQYVRPLGMWVPLTVGVGLLLECVRVAVVTRMAHRL